VRDPVGEEGDRLTTTTLAKLAAAGIPPDGDPFETFQQLCSARGRECSGLDLYVLVARARGVTAAELPRAERRALALRACGLMFAGFESTGGADVRPFEPIEIAPYDDAWPVRYERWRGALVEAVGSPPILRVEHVGSTSVPGLPAKPVVDVQVSVAEPAEESTYVPPIERLGLQLHSRDDDHRFFRPVPGRPRDVHVHVTQRGSRWEREHLLFRDFLRADADARTDYAATKRRAAVVWRDDRFAYTEAKSGVILAILDGAERWAAATGWGVR
jgi:GrpB-like predicted nucleotidyltransferase (UPF0157 family)